MFDEFFGLPLHVFIIHLTVVMLPATASVAIAYAFLTSWRWLLRWPLVLMAVGAPVVTFVTVQAGKAFKGRLGVSDQVIGTHEDRGELLLIYTLVFAVLALAAAFLLGGPSLLASGAGARESPRAGAARPVQIGLAILLVVAAVLVIVQVILTGDAGSRAVWSDV